jgi:DNA polymerase-3 subunit gamma/tau
MAHQALYRKYRSKTFDELLGQDHVVNTLKNQIVSNNIAHAYLFCGIRGTGKTSTAKILARAVNCTNNTDGNPCNECESCKSILNDSNIDVIEMDAASNNGVEDIRDLRDKLRFLPVSSKYKVYIIDEVHMLSKGAFNALLKTLEEPPSHLLFILATTEPQKIPATILSRCQRFDLKRITVNDIVKNMRSICDEIGVEADDRALKLIASNADGAMRDALSILDRCMTFKSEKIKYEDVNELLGIVNFDTIVELCGLIIDKNIKETMLSINDILNQGKDLQYFIEELITYFRNLLIFKTTNSSESLLRLTEENVESLRKYIASLSTNEIVSIIGRLSDTLLECKRAVNPRILFEARIISLMESNSDDISILQHRIEKLEEAIKNGISINNSVNSGMPSKKDLKVEQKYTKSDNTARTANTANKDNKPVKVNSSYENIVAVANSEEAEKRILDNWNDFLKLVRNESISLLAVVRECKLAYIRENVTYFEFDPKFSFHHTAANQEKNKSKIKEILMKFLNADYDVSFILTTDKNDNKTVKSMDEIYEDMKSSFGEDKVVLK